jgi:4-amino-4-deoxy-L-arabinose transferase-like glycosyltransferase
VQVASWQWLALVGVVMGAAFLTKMLQGFLVLPGFGMAYLLAAPTTWRKRLLHLTGALAALIVSAGWWVLAVQLIPAGLRPYIGGSTNNTVLDLAFGYNGLGRLVGRESDWGGATGGAVNTTTGPHRLFTTEMGNEISWLLPVALFATGFGAYLALRGRLSRDECSALVSWGGWLPVTGVVFSYMHGTIHPYYTVALAPALDALIGLSSVWAWRVRAAWDGRIAMALLIVLGGWWSSVLLRHNGFGPQWLSTVLLATGAVAAVGVLIGRRWPWSAATNGSQSAAALELATRTSVMAIGGWSGDPTPTLAQFVDDVRAGRIAYYVEAGRGGAAQLQGRVIRSQNHSASHSREIADWVADHYRAVTVGTSLVYRLT